MAGRKVAKAKKTKGKKKGPSEKRAPKNGGMSIPYSQTLPKTIAPKPRTGNRRMDKSSHIHHACALTNPFCPAAKGYQLPDGRGGNSIPYQVRCHNTLTAGIVFTTSATPIAGAGNTTGNMLIVTPCLPYTFYATTAYTSPNYSLAAISSATTGSAFVSTNFTAMRVVSWGVIIRCISTVANSSGFLTLGTAYVNSNLNLTTVASGSTSYLKTQVVPVYAGMEVSWISESAGSTALAFEPLSTATTIYNEIFTSLYIELTGGVATATSFDIELFMNVEGQLSAGNQMAALAPPTAPKNPVAMAAREQFHNKANSFIEGGVAKAESFVTSKMSNILDDIMSDGMSMLFAAL